MITWRAGVVESVAATWPGATELRVALDEPWADPLLPARVKGLAYSELVGTIAVGDRVLLNVTALARGLGTGGYALVVALDGRLPDDRPAGPGHLVKARYTPLQAMVLGVDDQESEHHDLLRDADDLRGMPVVVADLHSALPAIIAGARLAAGRPLRVAYVMTDGGALPAWFSRSVAGLREAGWLESCITTGQAFGGDLEAVTVHTGLLAAKHVVGADLAVVAQGPGNLGTGTQFGFSGVAAGEAVNAAVVLRGRPVASLRVSGADERARHHGVSHHSLTAYGRVAMRPADVPVPVLEGEVAALNDVIAEQVSYLAVMHRLVEVPAGADVRAALEESPVRLSTMGRGLDQDPAAFLAAAVAGVHAAHLLG
ncbi:DUF3866 family protein [Cellulomonas edaphi]|uniref:DUF3866 family protein n=1 Tax=Cellulomonas edaphi TaxID=3053468 RepID=A0ABT7S6D9_9CELL|nr:DUF3866 family protein [Cellulomons edaphi]MDM7831183.1 DUF3866 family protein [Cellulomons edaphi]